jgi:uncharacterized FAD-dependent dehydrogenase
VVAAASEQGMLVTNGMSEYKRDKGNANSALVVSVAPEDFINNHPLSGVEFQRHGKERRMIWEAEVFMHHHSLWEIFLRADSREH